MKINIEATQEVTTLGGFPCRVWNGVTEDGVACTLFIHRIAVNTGADRGRFEDELQACGPTHVVPLSQILAN